MRLLFLHIYIWIADLWYRLRDMVRSVHSSEAWLGAWYAFACYSPHRVGLSLGFHYRGRREFEGYVDLGPFSFSVGRDAYFIRTV